MSSNPAFKIKRMCATTVFYGEEVIQITEIPKASVAAKRDERELRPSPPSRFATTWT